MGKQVAIAVGALLVSFPVSGGAATIERSVSALNCSVHEHDASWGNASLKNPTASVMYVGCAIENDSDLWHTNVDSASGSIRVRGYQWAYSHVDATACYAYFGTVGGTCGSAASDGSNYFYDIRPSTTTWQNSTDDLNFPYIVVALGAKFDSGGSTFYDTVEGIYWVGTQTQP